MAQWSPHELRWWSTCTCYEGPGSSDTCAAWQPRWGRRCSRRRQTREAPKDGLLSGYLREKAKHEELEKKLLGIDLQRAAADADKRLQARINQGVTSALKAAGAGSPPKGQQGSPSGHGGSAVAAGGSTMGSPAAAGGAGTTFPPPMAGRSLDTTACSELCLHRESPQRACGVHVSVYGLDGIFAVMIL